MIKLDSCPSLRSCINLNYPSHSYLTRQRDQAELPVPHVRSLRIGYSYQFINMWNSLPANIKQIDKLCSFKKNTIDYFVNSY